MSSFTGTSSPVKENTDIPTLGHATPPRNANSTDGVHTPGSARRVTWDEETIAEHDRLRGTRQKIDEPPTPYRYYSESELSEAESCSVDGEGNKRLRQTTKGEHDEVHNRQPRLVDRKDELTARLEEAARDRAQFNAAGYQNQDQDDEVVDMNREYEDKPRQAFFAPRDVKIAGDVGDDLEDDNNSVERNKFLRQRAGHYNEFLMMRAMREKHEDEDEEDESDGDDEAENENEPVSTTNTSNP